VVYADSSNTVSALNGQSCTIDVSRAKYRRVILNAIPIADFEQLTPAWTMMTCPRVTCCPTALLNRISARLLCIRRLSSIAKCNLRALTIGIYTAAAAVSTASRLQTEMGLGNIGLISLFVDI